MYHGTNAMTVAKFRPNVGVQGRILRFFFNVKGLKIAIDRVKRTYYIFTKCK